MLNDASMSVRKQAVSALSAYMKEHPEDKEVRQTWIDGVVGSVIDVEQQVVDRALIEIEARVFAKIIEAAKKPQFVEKKLVDGKFVNVIEEEEVLPADWCVDDEEMEDGEVERSMKRRASVADRLNLSDDEDDEELDVGSSGIWILLINRVVGNSSEF